MIAAQPVLVLVDDDEEDAFILRRAARQVQSSVSVQHLTDGAALFAGLRAGSLPPRCLVLLDLNMPTMDGFAVLERLRRAPGHEDLVVLVYSTTSDQHQVDRAYACGANGFITKPDSLAGTGALIGTLLSHWFEHGRLPRMPGPSAAGTGPGPGAAEP